MSACYPTSLSNRAYVHMELSTTSASAALSWYGGQQAYPTYSLTVPEPPTAWWFWVAGHVFDSGPNSKSRSRKQLGAKRKTLRLFNVIMSSTHPFAHRFCSTNWMKPSSKDQRQGCAPAYCFWHCGQFAPFSLHQVQAEHAKAKRAELQKTASYKEHNELWTGVLRLLWCISKNSTDSWG